MEKTAAAYIRKYRLDQILEERHVSMLELNMEAAGYPSACRYRAASSFVSGGGKGKDQLYQCKRTNGPALLPVSAQYSW